MKKTENAESREYQLKEVRVRLTEGHALYSEQPLSSPMAALDVMRKEMSRYDREVLCVVNMTSRLQPINFHIVSVGDINTSIAAIPNILKSGLLSNAASFLLLHNHPSGDVTPSQDDITTTRKVIEAGKILGLPCVDHIVVGGGNGNYCSLREAQLADFSNSIISMTADDIFRVAENNSEHERGKKTMLENRRNEDMQVPDFVQEAEAQLAKEREAREREEVTIKFGKGLTEPFQSKDGREFVRIHIPNQDPEDKTPWASFVLPAKAVHENHYGKGLWAKIPADGATMVTKPVLRGVDQTGKNIWQDVKTKVPNNELKEMVEAYKARTPQARKLEEKAVRTGGKADTATKDAVHKEVSEAQMKAKSKAKARQER